MFSALKRLTSRSDVNGGSGGPPAGLHTMSSSLQKKFSKGVQYNMKLIIKGDRNSGKTCLFRRLQGLPFVEEYTPTDEIQAASIQWNYKTADDVVKVDVWDVVDKAKKKKSLPNKLKIENSDGKGGEEEAVQEIGLDASFLDVYKNTNGVIFVFDITKNWTFDYVKREVLSVPSHIPILILGNHRDMGHHRAIASDSVHYFIESLEREEGSAEVRYAESSMRNGFGLKYIHKFFNLPFLQLQRETLLKQLDTNREENQVTLQELDFYAESDDANYDLFIEGLSQKRRQVADALAPAKLSLVEAQAVAHEKFMKEGNIEKAVAIASKPSIVDPSAQRNSKSVPMNPAGKTLQESASTLASSGAAVKPPSPPTAAIKNTSVPQSQGQPSPAVQSKNVSQNGSSPEKKSNSIPDRSSGGLDDFLPEESNGIDNSFFDEPRSGHKNANHNKNNNYKPEFESTDEDEPNEVQGNPLVAAYIEDIVPESYTNPVVAPPEPTEPEPKPPAEESSPSKSPTPKFSILSSSDEEDFRAHEEEEETEISGKKLDFKLDLSKPPLDLDLNYFLKDNNLDSSTSFNAADALSEFSSSPVPSHNNIENGEQKKSKKSSHSKHKKSKHKKSSKKDKDKHQMDLEDFLNGPTGSSSRSPATVDTEAYEAI